MTTIISIILSIMVLGGSLFALMATIGLIRFPDVYCRMHSTAKASTMSVFLIMLAAFFIFLADGHGVNSRCLLVIAFVFLTSPVGAHMIAKAAYHYEVEMWIGTTYDELSAYNAALDSFSVEDDSDDEAIKNESFSVEFE